MVVRWLDGEGEHRRLPWLAAVATDSLVVYVDRLSVLCGTPFTWSLRYRFARDADLATSSIVALLLFVGSVAVAMLLHRRKKSVPATMATARRGSIGVLLLRFVLAG